MKCIVRANRHNLIAFYIYRMIVTQIDTDKLLGLITQAVTAALEKPDNRQEFEKLLTIKAAAEYVDCSEETIRNWIKKGQLTARQWGRIVRIKPSDLDKLLVPTTDLED